MTKRIAMLILICGLLFASACQPTPEGSTMELRERDSFDFSEDEPMPIATETPSATARPLELVPAEAGQYDPPAFRELEHLNAEYDNTNFRIRVVFDADVRMLDRETWPVIKLLPTEGFTLEETDFFIRLFAGDEQVIYLPEHDKAYYERSIAMALESENLFDPESVLSSLRERYAAAPVTVEEVPFDIWVTEDGRARTADDSFYAAVRSHIEGQDYSSFSLIEGSLSYLAYPDYTYSFNRHIILGDLEERGNEPVVVDTMTMEEARAIADSVMNTLGMEDMALSVAEPALFYRFMTDRDTAWGFEYTYSPDGLFCEDTETHETHEDSLPTVAAPWHRDTAIIIINEKGVLWLYLSGDKPIKNAVLEDDLELLDMDSIIKCINDQFCYCYSYADRPEYDGTALFTINKMSLSYAVLSVPNEINNGQLVPVWYVYYTYIPPNTNPDNIFSRCMAFAAHNGSYVDPMGLTRWHNHTMN